MRTINALLNCISNFIFTAYEYLSVYSHGNRSFGNNGLGLLFVGLAAGISTLVLSLILGLIAIVLVISLIIINVIMISLIIKNKNCIQIKTMTGPVNKAAFFQRVECGVNP